MAGLTHVHAAFALWPGEPVDGVRRCVLDPQLERETFGPRARRIGPASRLGAVAAAACLGRSELVVEPARLGLFLGSAMGNIAEMVATFGQSLTDACATPSPTTFANSVGNMILFHAARATGSRGPGLLCTQEEASFEAALLTALDHGPEHGVDAALVGAVDGFAAPASAHAVRVGAPAGAVLGEGAGCVLLAAQAQGALAELVDVIHVFEPPRAGASTTPPDRLAPDERLDELAARVTDHRRPDEALVLHAGLRVDESCVQRLVARLGPCEVVSCLERSGWFPTASMLAFVEACERPDALHVHVTRDAFGDVIAWLLRGPEA